MFKNFITVLVAAAWLSAAATAQEKQGSLNSASLSKTPSEVEADGRRVQAIIDKSENHFKLGELNLKDRNFRAARAEFDKAIDAVLESGMDVRASPRLQTFYLQLVEHIHRMEIPGTPAGAHRQGQVAGAAPIPAGGPIVSADAVDAVPAQTPGFMRDQKFEPSPLDDLSKLSLSQEEWSAIGKLPDAAAACEPARLASAGLRGFRLGMTLAEVRRRLPQLRVKGGPHGLSSGVAYFGSKPPAPELKGLTALGFNFFDGRVAGVVAGYDDSIRWESLDEFARRTAEALRLPTRWHAVEVRSESRRVIICGDLSLVARFANPYSQRKGPVLSLEDGRAYRLFRRRAEEAAERRRLEEERKKQSFKP